MRDVHEEVISVGDDAPGEARMKVAILAGGLGSRLSEETEVKPKPMVEIGGRPILWHIMKHYAHYGLNDFVVALGYKGEYIKRYMVDYCSLQSDLTVSLKDGQVSPHRNGNGGDRTARTGRSTWSTPGTTRRPADASSASRRTSATSTFMLTWGDGVADVDLDELLAFHRAHGKLATMTPCARRRASATSSSTATGSTEFSEKPQIGEGWINGAFFVLEPEVFDYIEGDDTQWEREPLERLAREGQLMAYRHDSFWQCMDTLRDKKLLEELWANGAPWKVWR